MNSTPPRPDRASWTVAAAGLVALAVAMGIGRFAFTALLPLMLRDGALSAAGGAEWAAANYGGYLIGALTAARFSGNPRRGLLLGLLGVAVTTLATAAADMASAALLGAGLRAVAGLCSAWALVCASGWCLSELARRGTPRLGAWIYTGVGLGIVGAGLLAWAGGRQPAAWLWAELGVIAGAGVLFVLVQSHGQETVPSSIVEREAAAAAPGVRGRTLPLVGCYGIFGFGYIVPATFLPAMARELAPDPLVFGFAWPLFGLAAALSVAAVALWLPNGSRRRIWAAAQGLMALGTALPLAVHTLWAVAASAVLVGGTFMVVTMAGLQWAREARPDDPTGLLARMTAAFSAGQIAGPLSVRALAPVASAGWDPLTLTGMAASLLLLATASWLWRDAGPECAGRT